MQPIIYINDTRFPGPAVYPPPGFITGIPSQDELDAYPRMFTWGELKEIVHSGDLEQLMRNKGMQARYDEWMMGMKRRYGSTENYLTQARLPWRTPTLVEPTFEHSTSHLTTSTNPDHPLAHPNPIPVHETSHLATPGPGSTPASGASTPSSAGFVSLDSLKMVNGLLRRSRKRSSTPTPGISGIQSRDDAADGQESYGKWNPGSEVLGEVDGEDPVYLKWEEGRGLDAEKIAVLPNDWPYNVPHGVRHYCVWSRVPIAHPELVDYDPEAWSRVEAEGLGGFTGITPVRSLNLSPSGLPVMADAAGRAKFIGKLKKEEWYAADVAYGGPEMRKWAGLKYQSEGGEEVGKMVQGLWDERGWECLWFVNPPRLQSVPGFSHFHVFARRKTPEEIDAAEAA